MEVGNVVKGVLSLVPTAEGGRQGPIFSGYRGALSFGEHRDDGLEVHYDAVTVLDTTDELAPGESGEVTIHLVSADLFPHERLTPGGMFDVKEGHRVVGRVTITRVESDPRPLRDRDVR